MRVLVAGAGGFIGGHLARRLRAEGHSVRGVDIKPFSEWWQFEAGDDAWSMDLSREDAARQACAGVEWVFNLAADMGGIEFIEANRSRCMESVLINVRLLQAARKFGVARYLFTSSACVYRADRQDRPDQPPLKEEDAYPAQCEAGYGWEKLFSEQHCQHTMEDYGLDCRVVRLHNVFGAHGSWRDGREKAPAAICRKVAEAKQKGAKAITIYGDGTRTRTFMYVDDCVEGLLRIMQSEIRRPINLGIQEEVVTINRLVDLVQTVAGTDLTVLHDMSKAQGVYGRSSDNTMIRRELGWEPTISLSEGLSKTYPWIEQKVRGG